MTDPNFTPKHTGYVFMDNPILEPELVFPRWFQLFKWYNGESLHNGKNDSEGECCPDFSCCVPELFEKDKLSRYNFITNYYKKQEEELYSLRQKLSKKN